MIGTGLPDASVAGGARRDPESRKYLEHVPQTTARPATMRVIASAASADSGPIKSINSRVRNDDRPEGGMARVITPRLIAVASLVLPHVAEAPGRRRCPGSQMIGTAARCTVLHHWIHLSGGRCRGRAWVNATGGVLSTRWNSWVRRRTIYDVIMAETVVNPSVWSKARHDFVAEIERSLCLQNGEVSALQHARGHQERLVPSDL